VNKLHLNSIGNFILHFDNINEGNRFIVYSKIIDYLNLLNENFENFENHKVDSLFLFTEYVHPIGLFYQKDSNFGLIAATWMKIVDLFILLVLTFFTYYFLKTTLIAIIILFFTLWYSSKQVKRFKSRKFYMYKY
jgi:hypothetical protein